VGFFVKFKSEEERLARIAEVRHAIISSALQEFSRTGYSNTYIESIAAGAGISKGSVFNYFASKEILRLESALYIGKAHCDAMKAAVMSSTDPNERLDIFYVANDDFVADNLPGMYFLGSCLHSSDDQLKGAIASQYEVLFQLFMEQVMVPGCEKGYFTIPDIHRAGRMCMSILINTSSARNAEGKALMEPQWVADFVRRALSGGSTH